MFWVPKEATNISIHWFYNATFLFWEILFPFCKNAQKVLCDNFFFFFFGQQLGANGSLKSYIFKVRLFASRVCKLFSLEKNSTKIFAFNQSNSQFRNGDMSHFFPNFFHMLIIAHRLVRK